MGRMKALELENLQVRISKLEERLKQETANLKELHKKRVLLLKKYYPSLEDLEAERERLRRALDSVERIQKDMVEEMQEEDA